MNHTAFDDHIKKQFMDYEPEVPSRIWDAIIAGDRKRPVAWWMKKTSWLILGLLFISGAGIIFYQNKNAVSPDQKQGDNKNNITSVSPTPEHSQAEPIKNSGTSELVVGTDDAGADPVNPTSRNFNTGSQFKMAIQQGRLDEQSENDNDYTEAIIPPTEFVLPRHFLTMQKEGKQFSFSLKMPGMISLPIPCPTPESNAAANKKYIEVYAGPDYGIRSFSDTGNSVYLSKRKESTKFLYAFSAGLRYTRVFNNGMSVRTGINYSQITEKFTYKEGNIVQVVYIIDNNGDTTGSYMATGTKYKTTMNRYHTADIPLIVGYEVGNGRLHANLNAGAMVNIYSWQKGNVLDTLNKPVDISTGSASSPYQFRKNIGVGFVGAVSVYYKLNDRMHILAEPYFRYNFSSASKPDLTLKQKYNTAGIRLGVRLDLP